MENLVRWGHDKTLYINRKVRIIADFFVYITFYIIRAMLCFR